ncbi:MULTISPECIES: phosphate/phosphite/phosphonate ABC transporter substrate-binding protein [Bacillaceae]|uniref:Phosphate/phosphite/phosphonate ABC transporter substrate-binding protein n=1 Tax=Evansella alkalicola TaxID=745819 RepID=A0ABS6JXZ6_9BACI|nr:MULTISPECIES: phosphate/phosphite/phosphonate ABC transporter substrate-binding protein [Bacillaceae]MBU9723473.1 phosphate/phosphite/phosphonate ABC transporter substrate-binding protein [Bacillus alkalicola]
MKKLYTTLFSTLLALSLVACGSGEEEVTESTASAGDQSDVIEYSTDEEVPTDEEEVKDEEPANEDDALPDEIVMGFVPSQDSDQIADTVVPLAERLSEELGISVRGEVMTNYTALVEAMGNDRVHIGFIPAFGYVLATERYDHIEAILKSIRHGSSTYKAQYTVRNDSDIGSLADLEGKVWAFPDLASTSGYLFPAAQIMDEFGVTDVEGWFGDLIQAGSHDNALVTVFEGDADVATTFDDARTGLVDDYPEMMEETRVIGYTNDIPNDTISVNTNTFSAEYINKITEVFLSFNDDEHMISIMDEVYNWTGIDTANDSEYDVVRTLYEYFSDSVSLD